MRVQLQGLSLETAEYEENGNICFKVFTYGSESSDALGAALEATDRMLSLERGGEHMVVRVSEHDVWPRPNRRLGDTIQRHVVQLEIVDPRIALPMGAS